MTKSYSDYQADIAELEKKLAAVRKSADEQKKKEDAAAAKKLAESKAKEQKDLERKRCFAERALFDYMVALGFPDSKDTMESIHNRFTKVEKDYEDYSIFASILNLFH